MEKKLSNALASTINAKLTSRRAPLIATLHMASGDNFPSQIKSRKTEHSDSDSE